MTLAGKTDKPKHGSKQPARARKESSVAMSLLDQTRRSALVRSGDRRKEGKAMRQEVPFASHAEYAAASDRPDPVALLESQDAVRQS